MGAVEGGALFLAKWLDSGFGAAASASFTGAPVDFERAIHGALAPEGVDIGIRGGAAIFNRQA